MPQYSEAWTKLAQLQNGRGQHVTRRLDARAVPGYQDIG